MIENLASPLAFANGNVRVFRAIVETLVLAMLDFRHDLAPGGAVGAEFVVIMRLEDNLACAKAAPTIAWLLGVAADLDDFVEMPDIAPARFLSFQPASIVQTKFHRPVPNGFVIDGDPPLEQQFFDQPQAERKSKIQPNGMGDDLRRKAVAFVADRRLGHRDDIPHNLLRRS